MAASGAAVLLTGLVVCYAAGWAGETVRPYVIVAMFVPLAVLSAALGFRAGRRGTGPSRRREESDPLTGLADRAVIAGRLAELGAQPLDGDRHAAVLVIDVDHLGDVNDRYGAPAGDAVLTAVAAAVRSVLRAGDTAGRIGGDEFAVILRDLPGPTAAARVAERLVDTLRTPVIAGEHVVEAGASVGVAVRDEATPGGERLLRHAGAALDAAKRAGRGRHEIYRAGRDVRARDAELRRAIDDGGLVVLFQPVVGLATGGVVAVEALVRWLHPRLGLLVPDEFLDLAEETGAIVPLGEWVLQEACREAARWRATVPGVEHVRLSVNLSPEQVVAPGMVETVRAVLEETGLPADRLVLELAEGTLRDPGPDLEARLASLRELGAGIAVDDVGLSSLGPLRRLPVDHLKIDGSLVAGVAGDPVARTVVEEVVRLGAALGATVVAEGVETAEQARVLAALGCGSGQGFHFCEPLHGRTVAQVLRRTHQGTRIDE
ncbi:diguanylate cyclase (GGDEF)-like protein [Couchioplanes caeruleus]|uniref:Diguanylate cyclase (GGDEF)-like protein n=1 Tax=Couchioplanes caeruleus TaxID=56438 RepID=A0A3N1GC51_9ACTN|nr:diguanylate cyclase (GGDEF)-like protein [Couchioplanes caeruleus]